MLHSVQGAAVALCSHDVVVGAPPRTLIAALSLKVHQGERWAMVGDNGCGKTVTSSILAGLATEGGSEHISFDSHRRLLRDELRTFRESRFDTIHKRATPASFLFPELYPAGARMTVSERGYRPPRTRLSPLPVRYDAGGDDPLLAGLEEATCTGEARALLEAFGLLQARHRPLHALSTGQLRKVQLAACLLSPPRLLILDEALDGLDAPSRVAAMDAVSRLTLEHACALIMVAHRRQDLPQAPTHALLLGLGKDGRGWRSGAWEQMEAATTGYFEARDQLIAAPLPPPPPPPLQGGQGGQGDGGVDADGTVHDATDAPTVVELRGVSIHYDASSTVFEPPLDWTVREGENWAVLGGNGAGKTTLVDLLSGENVLAYAQDVRLFGRRKGSGESVWSIRRQLGLISSATHMAYADFADPTVAARSRANGFARREAHLSPWEVVLSGFFDSIGLYASPSAPQVEAARAWVERFHMTDLVQLPARRPAPAISARLLGRPGDRYAAAAATAAAACRVDAAATRRTFAELSFGQQKLVLLCRAMVKRPRLLLLDEPSHGLSASNRQRLLEMLTMLAHDPSVAIVHVTHREDEVADLGFERVLRL